MGGRTIAALGALLAVLAAPSGATAAGWSAPVELTPARGVEPRVAIGPDGGALVAWGHRGADPAEGGGPVSYSVRAPEGGFGPARPVAPDAGSFLTDFAANARGDVAVTWFGGPGSEPSSTATAFRPAGGAFGAPAGFAQTTGAYAAGSSAVDGDGNTTWAWTVRDPGLLRTVTRFADGSFGPVRERAVPFGGPVAVAADGAGNLVYAWVAEEADANRVYVATAVRGGEIGPARPLSEPFGGRDIFLTPKLRLTANERGDVALAWVEVPRTEPTPGLPREDQTLHVAVRPAGGDFGPAEAIRPHDGRATRIHMWDLAISPAGDVIATWADVGQAAAVVRPAGGPAERAVQLDTDNGERAPAAAFDGKGNAIVVYAETLAQHHHRILALHRPPGGAFRAPVVVHDAPHLYAPDIAANSAGEAVLAWSRQDISIRDSREDGILGAVYDPSFPTLTAPAVDRAGSTPGLEFKLSAAGPVVIRLDRRDGKRWTRIGKARATAKRGRNLIRPGGKLAKRLRTPGTYRATLSAALGGGLETPPRRLKFRVRPQ